MWWKDKRKAFVLADSMVALFIVVLATTWFLLVESQLAMEHRQSVEKLAASRLSKECADQYQLSAGRRRTLHRGNLTARASSHSVVIYKSGHLILEVRG